MERAIVRRLLGVAAVAVAVVPLLPLSAAMATPTASLIHVTDTSKWHKPSPDPQGLAYQPSTSYLVVPDSEVEETKRWVGVNVWFASTTGKVKRSWSTTDWSVEPTDVAVRGKKTLFFTDDHQDRIFRVRLGHDSLWGTPDDRVFSFPTRPFGSHDPSGLAFGAGSLFDSDGKGNRVYRIDPGPDGRFDGVSPDGDDVVSSFDTWTLGVGDPEAIAYDPDTGYLNLPSRQHQSIVRVTVEGAPVDSIDLSSFGVVSPAGIAFAPGSDDPSAKHVYVADRGIDNNADPNENDGRIFEFALAGS